MVRLCIYTNSTRDLLYDGDTTDPRVELLPATREVKLDGQTHKVVNNHAEPRYLGLWVA